MFNIFKEIKQLKMKKEELELEREQMLAVINKLNTTTNQQSALISQLQENLDGAIARVKYLAGQLDMKEAQQKAATQFNDNNRDY